jgi:hypothetical protein
MRRPRNFLLRRLTDLEETAGRCGRALGGLPVAIMLLWCAPAGGPAGSSAAAA